ncbi:MAG: DUF3995 domain-containing protein [bacterium]|nr:DUF3995 domain-containing protein [bacterium]
MEFTARHKSAFGYTLIIGVAALLHAYWALGGTWFIHQASGGGRDPGVALSDSAQMGTWGLVAAMVFSAILALGRVKLVLRWVPQWFYALSCSVMAVCMLLGSALNLSVSDTVWERWVFGPLFLLLFLLVFVIALPERRVPQVA